MISEKTLETLVELLGDTYDRLVDAEESVEHWRMVAGREALKVNELEGRLMLSGNEPNGSEKND